MALEIDELKAMLKQQMKLMDAVTSCLSNNTAAPTPSVPSIDQAITSMTEFLFDPAGDVTFETWFKRYEDMFKIDLAQQDDAWKVRQLLRKLGPREHDRYSSFILPRNPRDVSFNETIEILSKLFGDTSSLFNNRYQCFQLTRRETDDYLTYAGHVNRECAKFQLASLTEDQFRCLIYISGLRSPSDAEVRTRLLAKFRQDSSLTLQMAAEECQSLQNLKRDSAMIQRETIHAVSSDRQRPTTSQQPEKTPPSPCRYCGAWHFHRDCPYRQHRCKRCHQNGHKEGFCPPAAAPRKPPRRFPNRRTPARRQPVGRSLTLTVRHAHTGGSRKYVNLEINGQPATLQLDTASDVTIISKSLWRLLGQPQLEPSNQAATSACGGTLQLSGILHCCVSFRGATINTSCYVTSSKLNLLGLDWIESFGLHDLPIRTICNRVQLPAAADPIVKRFPAVFSDELGLCSHSQATLQLIPGSRPVFRPKRPVPYAAINLVDQELQRLENAGIISPVTYSAWAAPIVVVKKSNGSIRLCADYSTGLNDRLETNHHPLPLPEDLFTTLNGGTCFAKLDLAEAYHQVEVAPESRELLTINTHRGLFQYNRLPFGVKTGPAIFQQIIDTMISGLSGTSAYLDDIIVMARSPEELTERLDSLLRRVQEYGFRLRPEKCQFFMSSIKYLGFVFDVDGRHPDPENIRAIQRMPQPHDVPSLRSFLGLISYYSAFLPKMHALRAPLNHLLQKDVTWNWSADCEKAFAQLKSLLSKEPLLTHYNPELPIVVAADASSYGIGAVISHTCPDKSTKAIAHASRTLTTSEKNYGQIEKEALALVFAVKKFHKMLYGRHFTLLTDHKPLLSIFGSKKGVPVHSANRLQRWATILLGYDFDIKYQRTEDFGQADGLSRLINRNNPTEETVIAANSIEPDVQQQLNDAIRATPITIADVRAATKTDAMLQQAIKYTSTYWPPRPPCAEMSSLFQRRESLSVVSDCLMFNQRVVVPRPLQLPILRQFHAGHPGTDRMKAIARSFVYWTGLDKDIESWVKRCSRCQQAAKHPTRQQPVPWPETDKPWSRVHIDFAGPINGVTYLILVDAHTKWPEVIPMSSTSAAETVAVLRRLFTTHGLPDTLISDNGSQYSSAIFEEYCQSNNIQHVRSPPYHPQSNGLAERFVDTFKRALLKAKGEGTTDEILQKFLLVYRTTPNPSQKEGKSPAEALMGRDLRTVNDALRPQKPHKVARSQNLPVGTNVYARNYRPGRPTWISGTLSGYRGSMLAEIQTNHGLIVRHKNQIRPRHTVETVTTNECDLPLDILLDTFELTPDQIVRPLPELPTQPEFTPSRSSLRRRRPPSRIQVNPRRRQY